MEPLQYLHSGLSSIQAARHALYLDPGSGSYIIQLLLASLFGGLLLVRAFWSRIVGFFRRRPRDEQDPTDE